MFQWLGIICGGLFLLFLAYVVVKARIYYRGYVRSDVKHWRDEVLQQMDTAHRRAQAEQETAHNAGVPHEAEDQALRDRAFHSYLASIPVAALEAFPGIGPATVAKLRDAGFRDLAALQDSPLDLPGLGQKRQADVRQATQDLAKEARSRFNAGACREAQNLAVQLQVARASRSEEGFRAQARALAAVEVMKALEPMAQFAEHIDFSAYLRQGIDPVALRSFVAMTVPDLEATLQAADEEARRGYLQLQQERAAGKPLSSGSREGSVRRRPTGVQAARSAPGGSPVLPSTEPPVALPASRNTEGDLFRQALQAAPAPEAVPGARPAPAQPQESKARALLHLTVEFAFAVARSDGRISRKEREVIDDYLQRRWGQDAALANHIKGFCARYESSVIDPDSCMQQIGVLFPAEEKAAVLQFGYAIADASGGRNPREEMFLEKAARYFGMQPPAEPALRPPAPEKAPPVEEKPPAPVTTEDRRALLEIDASTPLSVDLIRRQFNLLSERYAPEKFAAAGPEFVAIAQGKRDAVRAAALALIEPFGEPLELPTRSAEPQELRHNPDLDALFGD